MSPDHLRDSIVSLIVEKALEVIKVREDGIDSASVKKAEEVVNDGPLEEETTVYTVVKQTEA